MFKRKDGRWAEYLKMPSGKRVCFYGKTKTEVLRKIREYKEKEETGILFEEVADAWWEDAEKAISFTTARSYQPAKCRAVDEFGGKPIKDITPSQIAAHIQKFARTHAHKTVQTQLLVYNLIYKYAVNHGYVMMNAARDLTVPANLPKQKRSAPSPEDIQRVKDSTNCTFGMFAYWLMYTGLRRGELLALRWEDVDPVARTITVNKSVSHKSNTPIVKSTKTATSKATLPILDALYSKIKFKTCGLVFPGPAGTHLKETEFRSRWKAYCRESGVTATPHQFRHCFATMLFEGGIPPQEAQVLLRHAQISTTMDVYTDIRDGKRKEIFDKVKAIDIG